MALSPSAAWLQACVRAQAEYRFLMHIYDGTNTWSGVDGRCDDATMVDYPVVITKIDTLPEEIDPLERSTEVGSVTIEVAKEWWRDIVVNNRVKGKRVRLYFGEASLAESNFLQILEGPLQSWDPGDRHTVSIEVWNTLAFLEGTKIVGAWANQHPYEVAEAIALEAGVLAGNIDSTSFDPDDAANDSIGHFVVSRASRPGTNEAEFCVFEPTSALDLLNELGKLTASYYVVDETGKLKVIPYDSTASTVDDWTEDDFVPGSFKQLSLDDPIINRVNCTVRTKYGDIPFTIVDTDSTGAYNYPTAATRELDHDIETDWLFQTLNIAATVTSGATSMSIIPTGPFHAISGSRGINPGPQGANAPIDSDHPLYLMIWDYAVSGKPPEIVKCTSITFDTDQENRMIYTDPSDNTNDNEALSYAFDVTTMARHQFGTTAQNWYYGSDDPSYGYQGNPVCADITPLVYAAESILKRYKYGAPKIEVALPLHKAWIQVGDFVGNTEPNFLSYGQDGLDGTEKFEVVSKSIEPYASPPQCKFVLVQVVNEALTTDARDSNPHGLYRRGPLSGSRSFGDGYGKIYTVWGLTVAQTSALTGKVYAGTASIGDLVIDIPEDITHTFTDEADTYVYLNMESGDISFADDSSAVPQAGPYDYLLAVVTCTGGAITGVVTTSQRTTTVEGSQVNEDTVAPIRLNRTVSYGEALNVDPSLSLYSKG